MAPSITLSRLDTAKRQLETFIRLYFHSSDPVSMRTLVAAADQLIGDIHAQGGEDCALADYTLQQIKPEQRKAMVAQLKAARQAFTLADQHQHDAMLVFDPEATEFIALEACVAYASLTGERPPLFQIFQGWMMASRPDIFTVPKDHRALLKQSLKAYVTTERGAYFNDMLQFVLRSGV